MPSVRSSAVSHEPSPQEPGRLPLRWAVILLIAAVAAVPMAAVGGFPAAIAAFITFTGALHVFVG